MTEPDFNFVTEMLRAIRAEIGEVKRDLHRLEVRQTAVEGHLSGVIVTLQILRKRADETRDDIRLVKRRLDLTEAH